MLFLKVDRRWYIIENRWYKPLVGKTHPKIQLNTSIIVRTHLHDGPASFLCVLSEVADVSTNCLQYVVVIAPIFEFIFVRQPVTYTRYKYYYYYFIILCNYYYCIVPVLLSYDVFPPTVRTCESHWPGTIFPSARRSRTTSSNMLFWINRQKNHQFLSGEISVSNTSLLYNIYVIIDFRRDKIAYNFLITTVTPRLILKKNTNIIIKLMKIRVTS